MTATHATTWLDIRSPSLLISPWVSIGRVIHETDGLPRTNTSTRRSSQHWTIFNLPNYLTRHDELAGDFSKELDLTAPRTYCPMHLLDPPTDAEMADITGRIVSHRHANCHVSYHVRTGSGRVATDS